MKLIYCPKCGSVFNLELYTKQCTCGASKGRYKGDGLNAEITSDAVPLGFANQSFHGALALRPEEGPGKEFTAFVIENDCPHIRINNNLMVRKKR